MFKKIINRFFYGPSTQADDLLKTVSPPYAVQYSIVGLLLGMLFPIVGMVLLTINAKLPISWSTVLMLQQSEPLLWIIDTAPLFLGIYALVSGLREDQIRHAFKSLIEARENVSELKTLTQQLQRRSAQLHTIAGISEQFSITQNVNVLLRKMLDELQQNFGYYHAHVYLLDEDKMTMRVAEGTGKAGETLKNNRHSIAVDAETSLVARAARSNEVVWVDNVRDDPNWLANELLPHTYSEIAVPISIENDVLGILDVQESKRKSFDEGDAEMLKLMATQVALAIRDAKMFAGVEEALAEAQAVQARYQQKVWNRDRIERRASGRAIFNRLGNLHLDDTIIALNRQTAIEKTAPVRVDASSTAENEKLPFKTVVAPVKVDNIAIGNLQLYRDETQASWTESELNFIETIIGQVAQAAENLRLFEETQERAAREQLIAEIGEKMRRAPNIKSLMSVTTSELMRVLGNARTIVQLGDGTTPTQKKDAPSMPPSPRVNGRVRHNENGQNKE